VRTEDRQYPRPGSTRARGVGASANVGFAAGVPVDEDRFIAVPTELVDSSPEAAGPGTPRG
jgi:hypothetical protein